MTIGKIDADSLMQFGNRRREIGSGWKSALRVNKDSHRIRKPSLPLPQAQYRPPIIIHTYSPEVIHSKPDDFMSLVQKLTGSNDTRLRLKRLPCKKDKPIALGTASTSCVRQHSFAMNVSGSASNSEDSAPFALVSSCGEKRIKQSDSPKSPLDSAFEFDYSKIAFPNPSAQLFSNSQVKAEPVFPCNDTEFYNVIADFMQQPSDPRAATMALSGRPQVQEIGATFRSTSLQSPDFLSTNLMPSVADPSTGLSQSFLDCLTAPASTYQVPYQRQQYAGEYMPSPDISTIRSLENIQAFMLS